MYTYKLPKGSNELVQVCQKFFSSTIGFERDSMGAALRTIGSLQNGQVTKNPVGVYTHDESIIKRAAVEEDIMKNYKQQKSHHKSKKQVCSIQVEFFLEYNY